MAISLHDLANILDKIILSEYWKWLFRASRFQIFWGKKPQIPLAADPISTQVIRLWLKNIPNF